jgi:hypothetical protein
LTPIPIALAAVSFSAKADIGDDRAAAVLAASNSFAIFIRKLP